MSFLDRLQALLACLEPHQLLWNRSLLQTWPAAESYASAEWIEALRRLDASQLQAFDNEEPLATLPASLQSWCSAIDQLCDLPATPPAGMVPSRPGLGAKKQHEIAAIVAFIQEEIPRLPVQSLIDIGGGIGHLARHLIEATALPVLSIDRQAPLQVEGRQGHGVSWPPAIEAQLQYVHAELRDEPQPQLDPHFHAGCLSIGLHTCGPLAWQHFSKSAECAAILNFGCCYDRLDPDRDGQRSARAPRLRLETPAYFLATRGRQGKSLAAFQLQRRVQSYRFALHLLLQEQASTRGFISMGHAPKITYQQSFSAYTADRLQKLGLELPASAAAIDAFYADPAVARQVDELWLIDLLRHRCARPLELSIMLDRALWLEERGRRVQLLQFFERALSPRNLGLYAI